jgi:UDP-N-acetylglucosamine--N-acetylmuramyl-(pentapeptide) pyrophosphoryl-undecaprenol N-acetylglucosamine transferase
MPRPTHVLFAGGGSTGYLHPGLAVAAYLKQRLPQARITFAGTGKAFERHSVRADGHEYVAMPSQPVPRNPFRAMRFVTDNVAGYWASRWYLKEHHVSLVVGLGGYASAPTVRAATSRGIPTVLLEQNAVPSPVTRWLSRSADMVCAGFDDVRAHLPADIPLVVTGNPARPAFEQLYRAANEKSKSAGEAPRRPTGKRRLVVIGGVGGARSLNESMPLALQQLGDRLHGWEVVHQTGEGHLQDTLHRYRHAGVEALVVSFVDELATLLFQSDLVVCRAGGTTLSELALAGAPAVFVPYTRYAEAYQLANADVAAAARAATMIDEASLESPLEDALVEHLSPLLADDSRRTLMSANMRLLARPDAASLVTDTIRIILGSSATGTIRLAA